MFKPSARSWHFYSVCLWFALTSAQILPSYSSDILTILSLGFISSSLLLSFWFCFVQAVTSCFLIDEVKKFSKRKSLSERSKSSGLCSFSFFYIIFYVSLEHEEGLGIGYGPGFQEFGSSCVPAGWAGHQLWVRSKGEPKCKSLANSLEKQTINWNVKSVGEGELKNWIFLKCCQARLTLASWFWRQSQEC